MDLSNLIKVLLSLYSETSTAKFYSKYTEMRSIMA